LLEVISQESERLTRIVGDIMLANQIDAGRLRLKDHEFDVAGLVRAVVEEMEASLNGREGSRSSSWHRSPPCGSPATRTGCGRS